jgi:class I lanthipeptide synthase
MTDAVQDSVLWQPLLVGPAADEARRVAFEIAAWVDGQAPSAATGLKGDASAALLLAQCELPSAAARLEAALVTTLTAPTTISLFGGISGLSWLLGHLADGDDVARAIARFDAALWRHLDVPRWEERHDLMSGLAGVGALVAERTDARAAQIAERVLFHLETTATMTDTGATWRTAPRYLPASQRAYYPDGLVDLGVAHGVAGVIGMLAQFVAAKIEPVRSRRLLEAAVAWLLDMIGGDATRFEQTWPLDVPRLRRLGWCNGHTGVAAVLLRAARALAAPALEATALDLLHRYAAPSPTDGSIDAGFCHGAAGLAHIYNVAFQLTGDPQLQTTATRWLDEVLRLRAPTAASAGYSYVRIDEDTLRWGDDATLLSGAAGTALVLVAAGELREPEWQRLFLV